MEWTVGIPSTIRLAAESHPGHARPRLRFWSKQGPRTDKSMWNRYQRISVGFPERRRKTQKSNTYRRGRRLGRPALSFRDPRAATVLLGFGHEFGSGDTEALETELLWKVPEIKRVGGLGALKVLGRPSEVVRAAKTRLFSL
jgi:hypothetical protein